MLTVLDASAGLQPGEYLALAQPLGQPRHRQRRGAALQPPGERASTRSCPRELAHLAWLDLASEEGQEYWAAMELMGRYAAANHQLIHEHVARALGASVLLDIENHHNFAWRERHRLPDGTERDVIVHRKGATPAGAGVLGIIPGSMAAPGYAGPGHRIGGVAPFGFARRRAPDEPDEGEGAVHVG